MREGAIIKDVYNHILTFVEAKSSTLASVLVKNIGFGVSGRAKWIVQHLTYLQTGIEFKDSQLTLNGKNNRKLKENMVVLLSIGFADLADPKKSGKK